MAARIRLSFELEVKANCTVSKSIPNPAPLHNHLHSPAEIHRHINQSWLRVEEEGELDATQREKSYPEQLVTSSIHSKQHITEAGISQVQRKGEQKQLEKQEEEKNLVKSLAEGYMSAID